ncbi:MAG TPA: hypothetical protein VFQ40_00385 [Actinomycetota bacterium]|nr:hypothetical protein [Actinomycetota bacterium]
MEQAFWGGVTLALLGVLVGLLAVMVTEDLRGLSSRRHLEGFGSR